MIDTPRPSISCMPKEALARIKINKLLEVAGWRCFDAPEGKANIALEPNLASQTYQEMERK